MGGRGATSGIYYWKKRWHKYGDEYGTVLQHRNIKYVRPKDGSVTAPMETMTNGRVYVVLSGDKIKSIAYYDKDGKRSKQVDVDHYHYVDGRRENPHTHMGYVHDEKGTRKPTARERRMIDRAFRYWYAFLEARKMR